MPAHFPKYLPDKMSAKYRRSMKLLSIKTFAHCQILSDVGPAFKQVLSKVGGVYCGTGIQARLSIVLISYGAAIAVAS